MTQVLNQMIQERWQQSARGYSQFVCEELKSEVSEAWRDCIVEQLMLREGMKLLDVGCGPGFFPVLLKDCRLQITGIDVSSNMIEEAKNNAGTAGIQAEFHVMDSHCLDFPDHTFDAVIARNVVWSLYEPETAYREWSRCLRPGGKMLIFDANWNKPLYDEALEERRRKDLEVYCKRFGETFESCRNIELSDEIDKRVPLGNVLRPEWDCNILSQEGLETVCDLNVGEQLWNERRKLRYRSTPMFMICGRKK